MDIIRTFENKFGGRWTGISFHSGDFREIKKISGKMYFCEAVMESSIRPITLTPENTGCPVAKWALGWNLSGHDELVQRITGLKGIGHETAAAIIDNVPVITGGQIKAITIGDRETPDIVLSFLQPESAMRLVQKWNQYRGKNLDLSISSAMSVCGSVAVGAYTSGEIRCSFGCPEARNHGKIGRDRMIMGMSSKIAKELC